MGSTDDWQRKHDADQILKAAEFRDRLTVTGAAGTLLISITFLHQIAPEPVSGTLILLVATWVVLLVSLAASLSSMETTERALRSKLRDEEKAEKTWNRRTRWLNRLSLGTLMIGVTMFAVFAAINLPWEEDTDARRQRGQEATVEVTEEASPEPPETRQGGAEAGRVGDDSEEAPEAP